jgi:hypothetical protein
VPVLEKSPGETVWEGGVHVFAVEGHPEVTRSYTWPSPIDASEKRRFFIVALQFAAIKAPVDSMR